MQAAVATPMPGTMPLPADMIANNDDDQPENQIAEDGLMNEVLYGFDRLRRMNHTELRNVISSRIALLENELSERGERRAAIDTVRTASKMLDIRRERAKRINRKVNMGSALAAVASTFLIVFIMA